MPAVADAAGLQDKLNDLLHPSTTKKFLRSQKKSNGSHYCPHLRLKEKRLDLKWLADGHMHNGSHAPLCVYTNNASARSMDAELRRAAKKTQGRQGKYAAVAGGESRKAAQSGKGKCSQEDTASVSSQLQDLTFSRRSSGQYRSSGEHASYEHVLVNVWDNEQLGDTGRCQYTDRSQGYPSMYPWYLPPGLTLSRQGQSEQHWHPEHEKTLHWVDYYNSQLSVPTWLEANTLQSRLELELARQPGVTRQLWRL